MTGSSKRLSHFARKADALLGRGTGAFDWRILDRLYPAACALVTEPSRDPDGAVGVEVRYLDPADDPSTQPVLLYERPGADEPGVVSVLASSLASRGRRSALERRSRQAQADRLFGGCAVHTFLGLDDAHRPGNACCASLDGKAETKRARGAAAGPRRFHPLLVLYGKEQKLTYARLERLLAPHEVELPGVAAPPPTYFPRLARVTPGGAKGGARKGLILHGLSIPDQAAGFVVEPSPQTSPDFLEEVVETLAAAFGGAFSGDATLTGAAARAEWCAWVQGQPRSRPKSEQARVEVLYEIRERVGRLTGRR